jgi:hypothetical protein
VTGQPLARLKKVAVERVAAGDPWDEPEYVMYPPTLKSPYGERRSAFGKERYSALGVSREDWEARQRAAIANWDCFGAPAALFCYIDRDMGLPQWADLGMYLQTVMLRCAPRACTVARRCRGRRFARPSRTSSRLRTTSSSSVACRSVTRTPRSVTSVRVGPRSRRRSPSSRSNAPAFARIKNRPAPYRTPTR